MSDPNLPEFVRVENIGSKPWSDSFDSRKYTIMPGQEGIVPREAAYVWFGQGPFFVQDPGTKRDRQAEYERLRGRYGCVPGTEGADGRWEMVRPRVRVKEPDGKEWILVSDDPSTDNLPSDVLQTSPDTATQIAALQHQLQQLQNQVAGNVPVQATIARPEDIPEDKPEPAQKRAYRRRQAKAVVPHEVEAELVASQVPSEQEDWSAVGEG